MPWVERHRRRVPGGWFRTTTVRSHYRRGPYGRGLGIVGVVIAILVIILLIALF